MARILVLALLVVACTKEGRPAGTSPAGDAGVAGIEGGASEAGVDAGDAGVDGGDVGVDAAFRVARHDADDSTEAKVGSWEVSVLTLPEGKSELALDGKVTKMTSHPTKGWAIAMGADTFHLGLPSKMKPPFAVGDEIHVSMHRAHNWHVGTTGSVLDAAGEPLVLASSGGFPKGAGTFQVASGPTTKTVTEGRKTVTTHEVRFTHVSGRQAMVPSGDVRRLVTPAGTFVVSGTSVSVDYTSGPIPPETSGSFYWTIIRDR